MPRRPEWQDSYFSNADTYTLFLAGKPARIRLSSDREALGMGQADLRRVGTIVRELWQSGLLQFEGSNLVLSFGNEGRLHRDRYAFLPTGEPGVYGVVSGARKVALLFTDTRKETRSVAGPDRRRHEAERQRRKRLEALLGAELET